MPASPDPSPLNIYEVLAYLDNPEFRQHTLDLIRVVAKLRETRLDDSDAPAEVARLGLEFEKLWGVLPPPAGELLDQDPRRWLSDAVAGGEWGLILITASTTNREIHDAVAQIRKVVRKRHQDALLQRRAQLVQWLDTKFDGATIAAAVFGRRTGLRRPTKAQVIAHTPDGYETELQRHYESLGLTYRQAEQRVYKILRGSEPPATAAVRMAGKRYAQQLDRITGNLVHPLKSEPLSHALTTLFRALPTTDKTAIRRLADVVNALFRNALADQKHNRLWAVVPIFPWTTDPEIRRAVTTIRKRFRGKPAAGVRHDATFPPVVESEPLSQAMSRLFTAITSGDTTSMSQHTRGAIDAILKIEVPRP